MNIRKKEYAFGQKNRPDGGFDSFYRGKLVARVGFEPAATKPLFPAVYTVLG